MIFFKLWTVSSIKNAVILVSIGGITAKIGQMSYVPLLFEIMLVLFLEHVLLEWHTVD